MPSDAKESRRGGLMEMMVVRDGWRREGRWIDGRERKRKKKGREGRLVGGGMTP